MYPRDFFEQNTLPVKNGQCFVLMPFAARFDEVYTVIKETVEGAELGFACIRADQLFGGGHIIADILRCLAQSEIVIADLTTRNPNVFYELGIAHTVKELEKVLVLSQSMDDVPFDLRPFRCITYEQSAAGLAALRKRLVTEIREVAKTAFRFAVEHQGSYNFQTLLSGEDQAFYQFEIPVLWVASDAVKFHLRVYRHALGRPIETIHDDTHFLRHEAALVVPGLTWSLVVEDIDLPSRAMFRLVASDPPTGKQPEWQPLLAAACDLMVRLRDLDAVYRGKSTLPFTSNSLTDDFCELYAFRRSPILSFDDVDPSAPRKDQKQVQQLRMRMAHELTFAVTALYATAKYLGLAEQTRQETTRKDVLAALSMVRSALQGNAGIFEEQQDTIAELMWTPAGAIIGSAGFREKLMQPGWEQFTMLFRFFCHFRYKLDHEVKETIIALERLTEKLDA